MVFSQEQGMYMFSSIWNAVNYTVRGRLEKTNWAAVPFMSLAKKFFGLGCKWGDHHATMLPCANNNASASQWWDEPLGKEQIIDLHLLE